MSLFIFAPGPAFWPSAPEPDAPDDSDCEPGIRPAEFDSSGDPEFADGFKPASIEGEADAGELTSGIEGIVSV